MIITYKDNNMPADLNCYLCYAAPLELLFSLNALVEPEEHPDCALWAKNRFSKLSEPLRNEILFFSGHYAKWLFATDVAIHLSEGLTPDSCTIEVINDGIRNIDKIEFANIFLGFAAFDFDKNQLKNWYLNPHSITSSDLKEQQVYLKVDDVVYFLEHTDEIKERIIWVINKYWDESFKHDWPLIDAYEHSVLLRERTILENMDPFKYVENLHPNIIIKDGMMKFIKNPDISIAIDKIKKIDISLSVFPGSYLGVNVIGDKLCITKNLSFQSAIISTPISKNLLNCLKACDDPTRLKMIKIFWNGSATTQELARILNLSPSTISLHLNQLKSADLVDSYKINKYVYYHLKPSLVNKLSSLLTNYFEES